MRLSPYAVALARAAELAGGVDALAAQLGYSRALLLACITGLHETPAVLFLKVVDYLMSRSVALVPHLPEPENPAAAAEQQRPR
jgi:hypothetical protein